MTRTDARELMMQLYYQMDVNNDFDVNSSSKLFDGKRIKGQEDYCNNLHSLLCNKKSEIDEMINKYSQGWTTERMPKTDLAIARVSTCEILYLDDVPNAVSINEAVDLAKKYGTEQAPKYINAVLGKIAAEA